MHELSIARSLVELAAEQLGGHVVDRTGTKVAQLRVRVGVMSGVVAEALQSAFDVAVIGTVVEGAVLEIETVGLAVWCEQCQAERELSQTGMLRCPVCQSRTPKIVRGDELELTSIEIETED